MSVNLFFAIATYGDIVRIYNSNLLVLSFYMPYLSYILHTLKKKSNHNLTYNLKFAILESPNAQPQEKTCNNKQRGATGEYLMLYADKHLPKAKKK